MNGKWLIAVAVAAAALLSGILLSTTATAAPATKYCLNGVSTTLPAPVHFTSQTMGTETGELWEDLALEIIADSGGTFYTGWHPGNGDPAGWYFYWGADPAGFLEVGYTTNFVGIGACKAAWTPEPARVAVCKSLPRGDGTTGMFQEITVAQWNDKDSQYFDAPAANWVEGLGLTCDNPVALGYKSAGYNVAWGGQPDPANDPHGVRGSGMNNIYPYFTK